MVNRENKFIITLIFVDIILVIILCSGIIVDFNKKNLNSARLVFLPGDCSISQILLESGDETLVLKNTDAGWRGIKDSYEFLTDDNVINGFLDELKKTHEAVILSSSLSETHRYGLDDENAFKIKFIAENGMVISDLNFGFENTLGENISYYSGIDNHIYSVDGTVSSYLNLKTSYWGELDLFYRGFDYNKLQGFNFISYDNSGKVEKNIWITRSGSDSWSVGFSPQNSANKQILPDTDINEYFRKVSLLRALDVSTPLAGSTGKEKYAFRFHWGDGNSTTFLIYENAELITMFSEFSDTWYSISSYTLEKLLPDFYLQ